MRKIALLVIAGILFSCGASKNNLAPKPLYEVLIQKSNDGAKVRFFEIISQPDEFTMIKSDPELKDKIEPNAIDHANFLILSMGEKPTGGYSIGIDNVKETDKNIIVSVKETEPKPGEMATMGFTNPYCVVRINSKKEIIIQ